ncbi:MAG: hypothetical protein ACOX1P_32160 [Thermoguttaceae bacterium]|jgi:hypothetical protein
MNRLSGLSYPTFLLESCKHNSQAKTEIFSFSPIRPAAPARRWATEGAHCIVRGAPRRKRATRAVQTPRESRLDYYGWEAKYLYSGAPPAAIAGN